MEETINTSSLTKSGTTFPEYISSINVQPILFEQQDEIGICEYTKIPLGKISAFGAAFASMLAPLQQITQTTSINMSGLYRAVDAGNNPILLKHMVNDGLGYATGYYENGLKTARMQPVSGVSSVQQLAMPFNPALMFMAISLMSVEKKLDDIQQTQIKILDFLKEDKRSELKGNITFLNDLLNNYKYNYDNDIYKNNMHVKVLDIKQSSEQNIEFYRNALKKMEP